MNKESRTRGQLKKTIEWQKQVIKSRDNQIEEMQLLIDKANEELKKLKAQTSSFDIVIPFAFDPIELAKLMSIEFNKQYDMVGGYPENNPNLATIEEAEEYFNLGAYSMKKIIEAQKQ